MAKAKKTQNIVVNADPWLPQFITEAASTRGRGTKSSQNNLSDLAGEVENVGKGVNPYGKDSSGAVDVSEAIFLCQKCFWNVSIFRNTIDIQTEFTNSKLHFRGKNKRSVKFFETWYKKIDGSFFSERWFREWFRSGNVFVYKHMFKTTTTEINKMARAAEDKLIPLKYTILNPVDMRCDGSACFVDAEYYKLLNPYELARLKSPNKSQEDKRFLDSLSPEVRKSILTDQKPKFKIESKLLNYSANGRQDYEAMAIPPYWSVITDIDLKLEFKKMEKVIARTIDYAILLITAGEEGRDANLNSAVLGALTELFQSESVGRVLISDYTTKGEFIIPDLNKILGSEKYKAVNEDIANGLMNIFWGEEKFANSMVKIKVFLERLKSAREAYLNGFLKKEMELIAADFGFTEIPEPIFEEVDLKDEIEYMKIYARLAEIGLLTPAELFDAMERHSFPLIDSSVESQQEYKKQKDKGLYEPLIGGPKDPEGRPGGSKAPQKKKNVKPIGASKFSLQKISDNIRVANDLLAAVEEKYRQKNEIKRLSNKQKDLCWNITESIVASVPQSEWNNSIDSFLENPLQMPDEEALEIAAEHNVSCFLAGVLRDSKI